jgi:undecaprenyl-diphosphatase
MLLITDFDIDIIRWINAFAGRSTVFDLIVIKLFRMDSVRHLPLVAVLIWAWFSDRGDGSRRRHVFDGVVGYLISIVVSRGAQAMMPHRSRPALDGAFDFHLPVGGYTSDWSSFPSDTAAQAFALVAAIWALSRPLGVAALFWAAAVVCFPRLYGGFHYPSDLLAGMVIGLVSTWVVSKRPLGLNAAARAVDEFEVRHKPWFYVVGFVVLYEVVTHLEDARDLMDIAGNVVKAL